MRKSLESDLVLGKKTFLKVNAEEQNSGFIDEQAHGVFIISTTPFSKDGSIDFDSVDSLVEFYIDKRVTGMTILGMMGEASKLSAIESEKFVKHVFKYLFKHFL